MPFQSFKDQNSKQPILSDDHFGGLGNMIRHLPSVVLSSDGLTVYPSSATFGLSSRSYITLLHSSPDEYVSQNCVGDLCRVCFLPPIVAPGSKYHHHSVVLLSSRSSHADITTLCLSPVWSLNRIEVFCYFCL